MVFVDIKGISAVRKSEENEIIVVWILQKKECVLFVL